MWVNQDRVGRGQYRANNFADVTSKIYPHNEAIIDLLKTIRVVPEEYSEVLLTGVVISPSWRRRGKMPIFTLLLMVSGSAILHSPHVSEKSMEEFHVWTF